VQSGLSAVKRPLHHPDDDPHAPILRDKPAVSIRHLDQLLKPASIAVIGASDRPGSLGAAVWAALRSGGFRGPLHAVNRRAQSLEGQAVAAHVADLPGAPELAFICTPPASVPGLVGELAAAGTRAAVLITAGLADAQRMAALEAAKACTLRLLGDGSFGVSTPALGLQGGLFPRVARPGSLALVGTSGAAISAVLAWAADRPIGFSHVVSLGEQADVDVGDLLDHLASDGATRAILLHLEQVVCARKFMAAARAAARNKPVIVLRSDRARDEAADAVYDAAFRRAGLLRVHSLDELFLAAETLAHLRVTDGERLTVLANGHAAAALAADACLSASVPLPALASAPAARVADALGTAAGPGNPVDAGLDASPERLRAALHALLADGAAGTLLWLHAAHPLSRAEEAARACLPEVQAHPGRVIACWLGEQPSAELREAFEAAGAAVHASPDQAARAFAMLQTYRANQSALLETPEASGTPAPDAAHAQQIVKAALAAGRETLHGDEAQAVLRAYGVLSAQGVTRACLGAAIDPVFGPVVLCGTASAASAVAPTRAQAVAALPPLNRALARELARRSGLVPLDASAPEATHLEALCDALIGVARMLADLPHLASLDIPCRAADAGGATATLTLSPQPVAGPEHFAILPYPAEWVQMLNWNGRTITLRPIRPEDEAQHRRFLQQLTPEDIRLRIFQTRRELPHSELARLTQIDYEREMAFIAEGHDAQGEPETLGVGRLVRDADNTEAEFALLVRSDLKGRGLGRLLLRRLIAYAQARGTPRIVAVVLRENRGMLALAKSEGFSVEPDEPPGEVLKLSRQIG
jgi:acetyl-CoA synthetase (ADP-forming)/acetyltransferase